MKIYGLHTGDYKIRYVGATTLPLEERLRLHVNAARQYDSAAAVGQWLRLEKDVQILEIEETDDASAEDKWIAILDTYRFGLNSYVAGRPMPGQSGRKHTKATRQKIAKSVKEGFANGSIRRPPGNVDNLRKYKPNSEEAKEFGKKVSKSMKTERWQCECGMISARCSITRHQHYSKHVGMKMVVDKNGVKQ